MEIIPTILVKTFSEVKEKIKSVEDYVSWVQLDAMDGIFVENTTWHNPEDLRDFKTRVKIEAHLMINKPEEVVDEWLKYAERIIVHCESTENIGAIIKRVHRAEKQIGVALNPETHPVAIKEFLKNLDLVLIMSVQPGKGGQEFKPWVLEKADLLKQMGFRGDIEIDGGINKENIKQAVEHGINLICVGSFIAKSKNIRKTIETLKQSI
jgi:ribulose-phosphate 3-epimerase